MDKLSHDYFINSLSKNNITLGFCNKTIDCYNWNVFFDCIELIKNRMEFRKSLKVRPVTYLPEVVRQLGVPEVLDKKATLEDLVNCYFKVIKSGAESALSVTYDRSIAVPETDDLNILLSDGYMRNAMRAEEASRKFIDDPNNKPNVSSCLKDAEARLSETVPRCYKINNDISFKINQEYQEALNLIFYRMVDKKELFTSAGEHAWVNFVTNKFEEIYTDTLKYEIECLKEEIVDSNNASVLCEMLNF